ncbi:MAG TPA: hypothetical protein VKI44_35015 [Acetobacteraceae bacterium]|nr:hypothetical protein [Acetobacteraceae bacterium]
MQRAEATIHGRLVDQAYRPFSRASPETAARPRPHASEVVTPAAMPRTVAAARLAVRMVVSRPSDPVAVRKLWLEGSANTPRPEIPPCRRPSEAVIAAA